MATEQHTLPNFIDPMRFAKRAVSVSGQLPLAQLSRLSEHLASTQTELSLNATFSLQNGQCHLIGQISGELQLICQRCLQPVTWMVDLPLTLAVVDSDLEADKLPAGCDPILTENDRLSLNHLAEDELLLNIPPFPAHSGNNCPK